MSLRDCYSEHFLLAELIISITLVIFLTWTIETNTGYLNAYDSWILANRGQLFPLIATIAGALLGFIITAVSVIASFFQTKDTLLSHAAGKEALVNVFDCYISAIYVLAFTTASCVLGTFIDVAYLHWLSYVVIWSAIISSLRIWRCLWALKNIIQIIVKPLKDSNFR